MRFSQPLTLLLAVSLVLSLHTRAPGQESGTGLSSSSPATPVAAKQPIWPADGSIQVWRDARGVPHIVAGSAGDAYRGFGYCMAQDRMFQLELLRRSIQGRLAEIFGDGFLDPDFMARRDRVSQDELEKELASSSAFFRQTLTAFTQGINAAIADAVAGTIPVDPAFAALDLQPTPFSELEVLEFFAGTMAVRYNDFTQELDNMAFLSAMVKKHGSKEASQIFEDVVFFRDPGVYSTLGASAAVSLEMRRIPRLRDSQLISPVKPAPTLQKRKRDQMLRTIGIPEKSGSYAAVVSNRHRGIHQAFLLGGPQMGYFKPAAVYEVSLHTPDFDLTGTTCTGYFALIFGANRNIGFTATAGVANQIDILAREAHPDDPRRLRGDRNKFFLTSREEVFAVKGRRPPVKRVVEETAMGPVFAKEGTTRFIKTRAWKGRVLASYDAWLRANHAQTLDRWMDAGDALALSIHWLGADRLGHIAYTYCGLGKTRNSFGDDRLPTLKAAEMPYPDQRISGKDPSSGFFANWNCPPHGLFRNGDMQTAWGRDQRTRFLADFLRAHRNEWSAKTMEQLDQKVAFTDLRAYFFRDTLLRFVDEDALTAHGRQALRQLREWDGTRNDTDNDGRFDHVGAGLFDAFWNRLFQTLFARVLGEHLWLISSDPTWTQSSILFDALKGHTSYNFLGGADGRKRVTGIFAETVVTLASEGKPLPYLPCPPMEFAGVNHAGAPSQAAPATFTPFMNRGSDVQIMSLSPEGIVIRGVMPPGNAAFGPHADDQVEDFRHFRYTQRPTDPEQAKWQATRVQVLHPRTWKSPATKATH